MPIAVEWDHHTTLIEDFETRRMDTYVDSPGSIQI